MPAHEMHDAYRETVRLERERDEQGRPANARPRDRFGRPLPRGARDELVHAQEPAEVVDSLDEALDYAHRLFDEERFFEAHEFLEHIWKSAWARPDDKAFWKGVTQTAVGCCHVQRGNSRGAETLLLRAAQYLDDYPPRHFGIDTRALAAAARNLVEAVRAEGASPDRSFPRFPRAPVS